jgi:large subunit ribosomal protein L15
MKTLGNLSPASGSRSNTKRLGRGIGSGTGKTAGKGHKGQKARKGRGPARGFEGGQTPLHKRLPKHGFTNARTKVEYSLVNLEDLNNFADGATIDRETLLAAGIIRKSRLPLKVLGAGHFERKNLVVKATKFSKSAKETISKLGGSVEEIS